MITKVIITFHTALRGFFGASVYNSGVYKSNLYGTVDDAWRYEYDYESYTADLPAIQEAVLSCPGGVLEIGAGTGRVAIHLARNGLRVAALEKSPAMIEVFRKKLASESEDTRARIDIVEGDALNTVLPERYGLCLLSFNFLQQLTGEKERELLFGRHLIVRGVKQSV